MIHCHNGPKADYTLTYNMDEVGAGLSIIKRKTANENINFSDDL